MIDFRILNSDNVFRAFLTPDYQILSFNKRNFHFINNLIWINYLNIQIAGKTIYFLDFENYIVYQKTRILAQFIQLLVMKFYKNLLHYILVPIFIY